MDSLDAELARARATLLAEVVRTSDTEAALAEVHRTATTDTTVQFAPQRRRRRGSARPARRLVTFAAAATIVGLVAALGVLSWVRLRDDTDVEAPADTTPATSSPVTTGGSTATTTPATTATSEPTTATTPPATTPATAVVPTAPTTAAPTTAAPTTAPAPTEPLAVSSVADSSWLDGDHGWVTTSDGSTYRTLDGGGTWTEVAVPEGTVGVRFADPTNGYADVGETAWWSTHDGGATWTEIPGIAPSGEPGGLTAIATGDTQVVIATTTDAGVGFVLSPIDHDDFADSGAELAFGAGPVMDLSIAAIGDDFFVVYNDRVVTGSVAIRSGVVESSWTPPAADEGGPVHVTADAQNGADSVLWAMAQTGIWSGDMEHPATKVFASTDGGATFAELSPPPGGDSNTTGFAITPTGSLSLLADVHPGGDSTGLYTFTLGGDWTHVGDVTGTLSVVAAPAPGVVIAEVAFDDGHLELQRSDDRGASWHPIVVGSPG